jgi:hypothetical protein
MKTGMRVPTHGAVVVTMADGSDDHAQIDQMYALFRSGYQVVAATRYSLGGKQVGGPLVKGLMSQTAGRSLHFVAGLATSDATNNYKLYSVDFLRTVEIESRAGFELALELTVKAHLAGAQIAEVPTVWRDRTAGKSNFKLMKWLPSYLRWYLLGMRQGRNRHTAALRGSSGFASG